jgi:hypothetical protein
MRDIREQRFGVEAVDQVAVFTYLFAGAKPVRA